MSIALDLKDDALEYLRISSELDAEQVESEKVRALASHELQSTVRECDNSIDEMTIEAENAALRLSCSRLQLALAASAANVLGILAWGFYRYSRAQRQLATAKDTFLEEVHHRKKSNFQVLTSLLNLDIRRSGTGVEDEARRLDAVDRLQTMALMHDHIYSLDSGKETTADLVEFVDDLMALLDTSLGRDDVAMTWSVEGGKIDVTRLTPFGLLLCELVTNSYKHAFSDQGGSIAVDIDHQGETPKMTLRDDGKGFDVNAAKNKHASIGMGLLFELADQVGGDLKVSSNPDGTVWTFE